MLERSNQLNHVESIACWNNMSEPAWVKQLLTTKVQSMTPLPTLKSTPQIIAGWHLSWHLDRHNGPEASKLQRNDYDHIFLSRLIHSSERYGDYLKKKCPNFKPSIQENIQSCKKWMSWSVDLHKTPLGIFPLDRCWLKNHRKVSW